MKKYFILLMLQMAVLASVNATQLNMKLSKSIEGTKTHITGNTNLPEGTKIGVEVTCTGGYRAQDFKVWLSSDGSFKSGGFSNREKMLLGKCKAKVFTFNNKSWQTEPIRKKLSLYKGNGIEAGEMEVVFSFTNKRKAIGPSNKLEEAFEGKIQEAKTKREKCKGILSVVSNYMGKGYSSENIYKGYDYIDLKYPGLIDSCDN
ncbi:MAG: hypothetical protein RPU90_12145 [Candidatus Sedimenticola sp. (ex Thyasira tokunagai)]